MTTALRPREVEKGRQWHQVFMDTFVTIELPSYASAADCEAMARAFGWFAHVEALCSRFDPRSELSLLCAQPGVPVRVSSLLYQLIDFATSAARASRGAFDPTGGARMQRNGFDRNYADGRRVQSAYAADEDASYRDILLDPDSLAVTLRRPLTLDLGAVAKGFAMDLGLKELVIFESCAINAGGDILVKGSGPTNTGWRIGIRHPRDLDRLIYTLCMSNMAVCTSGDYEKPNPAVEGGHHIIDPRSGVSPAQVISTTVIAPTAMAADALSTAAFVLGPVRGLEFVHRQGADCLIVTSDLEMYSTPGFESYRI